MQSAHLLEASSFYVLSTLLSSLLKLICWSMLFRLSTLDERSLWYGLSDLSSTRVLIHGVDRQDVAEFSEQAFVL